MMRWTVLLVCAISWDASAATLYLCRAYSGGSFWSSSHCARHSALIERLVSVPDGIPFEQQVHLGEQNRASAAELLTPSRPQTQVQSQTGPSKEAHCNAIKARLDAIDARARVPQSGQSQDQLRHEKRKALEQSSQLGC